MVAAPEVAAQEVAAKKTIKRCAVCLQDYISVTRPIYFLSSGDGDYVRSVLRKFPPRTATCVGLKSLLLLSLVSTAIYRFALSGM